MRKDELLFFLFEQQVEPYTPNSTCKKLVLSINYIKVNPVLSFVSSVLAPSLSSPTPG